MSSIEEAETAIRYGVHALGMVGNMPSGPGIISNNLIRDIVKTVPPAEMESLAYPDLVTVARCVSREQPFV